MTVNIKDFGIVDSIFFAHSADDQTRFQSSSGGFIKSFLVYLLESGRVDTVIITRTGDSSNPLVPETIITNSREDILSTRTNSVYALNNPLKVLNEIDSEKKYAFVGLPCHVRNLKLMQKRGKYKNIVTVIGIFCHHVPNLAFTEGILKKLKVKVEDVKQIEYRGNGWPGDFTAHLKNGQSRFISFTEVWSNDLNNGPKMCRCCSEIGVSADICVGDPWNLGLERTDEKGMSLVICRNRDANGLVKRAAELNYIKLIDCSEHDLIQSQGYHIEAKIKRKTSNKREPIADKWIQKLKKSPKFIRNPQLGYQIGKRILIDFTDRKLSAFKMQSDNLVGMIKNPDDCSRIYLACKVAFIRELLGKMYLNRVLIWYWREEKREVNFGDYITKVLLEKFGYKSVEYCNASSLNILDKFDFCLLIIGSELHKDMVNWLNAPQLFIWGQGKGHGENFDINIKPYVNKVEIFAVRGPHTVRQLKLSEKTPLGDPAFLMPLFFKVKRDPAQYKITYIPHHSNRVGWCKKQEEIGADRYVDIMCSRRRFRSKLKEIVSSKFVLTNTLHTAIICQAYGVPWALCLAEEDKLNFPDKWQDFFEFLGIDKQENAVNNYVEGFKWWENVGSKVKISDLLPLLDSFPLPIKNKKVLYLIKKMKSIELS